MTAKKKILISAHMGSWGANIPANTLASSELALRQGADILELDITKSADGELFMFHPGQEKVRLGQDIDIRTMAAREIEKLHFINVYGERTAHCVTRLDDALRFLKGRCLIDLDKFYDNPVEISRLVHDLHMQDQVVVLAEATPSFLRCLSEVAGDLPYMAIAREEDQVSEYLNTRSDLRFIGVDAEYREDSSVLATAEYVAKIHAMNKKVWINSIRFNDRHPLAGSRCDDNALCGDPDQVWGWMADTGYDIIQTDWPLPLSLYLRMRGY